jgi:4'-phosphopantetheinyl transferase
VWDSPPTNLAISRDEVHVWRASLEHPAGYIQRLTQTLSEDERQRADRFRFERDRRRYIVGRGLLRAILGRYLNLVPGQLRFRYGPRGKPALAETRDELCFNIAHSHELALYAVAQGQEVGVDIEHVHSIYELEQMAERFFSSREVAVLRALPPDQKQEAFFNCWTRKEAYIKAIGDGLSRPLDQFDVSLAPGEPARLLNVAGDSQEASRWSIRALMPASGYVAALAVAGHGWRLQCWQWV